MREVDDTKNGNSTNGPVRPSGSDSPALSIDGLEPDTIVRWEVRASNVILSRNLLAQVFPQTIKSTEVVDELINEERRALPLFYALFLIMFRILRVVLSSMVIVIALFALLWFLGSLANHNVAVVVFAVGLAVWLTGFAIVEAVTRVLCTAYTQRDQKSSNVRVAGFLSLPLMMYVTACPTTTDFVAGAAAVQPGFRDWSWYYCYTLIDILAVGIPQGVFGLFTAFHSPSLVGALSMFWVKMIMVVGVVAVIVGTIRHALTDSHTFVGTISQFRQWAKHRFGTGEEQGTSAKAFWKRWVLGSGKRRGYEVVARAVERPFMSDQAGVSLDMFQGHSFPEWTVNEEGVLRCREMQLAKDWAQKRQSILEKSSRKTLREQLRFAGLLVALVLALPLLLLVLVIFPAIFSLPVFLISLYVIKLDFSISIAIYALASLLFWSLDRFFENRRESTRFLILSRIRSHAIHGTGAVPSVELEQVMNGRTLGLVSRTGRSVGHLVSLIYKSIFRRSSDGTGQDKPIVKKQKTATRSVGFYESVEQSGGLKVVVTSGAGTAWIFHDRPFRSQGNLQFIYSVNSHLIVVPYSGRGEWLDVLEAPGNKVEGLAECDRVVTVLVRQGKEPSRPGDIQELPIVYRFRSLLDNLLHLGREFKGPEQAENPYRYSE